MLRVLLLALLLANAVYLVWTQGLLAPYGFAPASQAEPERLAQQIRPEVMQLQTVAPAPVQPPAQAPQNTAAATAAPAVPASAALAASATPAAASPAPTALPAVRVATQCLQAGPFTEYQASVMRARLQARLPPGSWSFESTGEPVRWMVYMGRYVNKAAMNKKRTLLEQVGVPFETPLSPQLNPGLSLGSYQSRAEADAALAQLATRGIRSARVVPERPDLPTQQLRLPAIDAAQQARLSPFILQLSGQTLQACR